MLDLILRLSVNRRGVVCFVALLLAGFGVWNFTRLPIDAVPDITNVQVVVNVPAPGFTPLEVEQRITFYLENAMAGMPRLVNTRSFSRYGLAQITEKDKAMLTRILNQPPTLEEVASSATSPLDACELYGAALSVIEENSPAETLFLRRFANALKLDEDLVAAIEQAIR